MLRVETVFQPLCGNLNVEIQTAEGEVGEAARVSPRIAPCCLSKLHRKWYQMVLSGTLFEKCLVSSMTFLAPWQSFPSQHRVVGVPQQRLLMETAHLAKPST